MKKLLLTTTMMSLGFIGNSYADIFGTNSSQTNFVIPVGDSVNMWGIYTKDPQVSIDDNGTTMSCFVNTSQVVKTITNTIIYVKNKPTIASVTNSVTNTISFDLALSGGFQINGPANLSLENCWINYKYNKKSQALVLMAPAGNTNTLTISIPAGKSFYSYNHRGLSIWDGAGSYYSTYTIKVNEQVLNYNYYGLPSIYGPATLKFTPLNPPSGEVLYMNYSLN